MVTKFSTPIVDGILNGFRSSTHPTVVVVEEKKTH